MGFVAVLAALALTANNAAQVSASPASSADGDVARAGDAAVATAPAAPGADACSRSDLQSRWASLVDGATARKDTDADTLPDSVERVLGTAPDAADTDADGLRDDAELAGVTDPGSADSDGDQLPDNLETGTTSSEPDAADPDRDGVQNACDRDSDGDQVVDLVDLSPYTHSTTSDVHSFDVATTGQPTYLDLELRPADATHLQMQGSRWNWPSDQAGVMQDHEDAVLESDVTVQPMLELTMNQRPDPAAVAGYAMAVPEEAEEAEPGMVVGGVDVGDANGDSRQDLVLFGTQEVPGVGVIHGYMVGSDLSGGDGPLGSAKSWRPLYVDGYPTRLATEYDRLPRAGSGRIADLDGDVTPDLVTAYVDEKRAAADVSTCPDLDVQGTAWMNWKVLPGTFAQDMGCWYHDTPLLADAAAPAPNTSGGVAAADLDGNGRSDTISVFMRGDGSLSYVLERNPGQINDGVILPEDGSLFDIAHDRYGYPVRAFPMRNGYPGTGNPLVFPSWSCSASAGCAASVARRDLPDPPSMGADLSNLGVSIDDLNGNGIPDLVITALHQPTSELRYMVGWDLGPDGNPGSGPTGGWSDLMAGPAVGASAAGGGATVADIDHDEDLDLLVVAVEDAEQHRYRYRVGYDLQPDGQVGTWGRVEIHGGSAVADKVFVPLTPLVDGDETVGMRARAFLPAAASQDVTLDARLVWMVTGDTDAPDTGGTVTLARYREAFSLTGFSATANGGTQAGMVSSPDASAVMDAGLSLDYEYLRDTSPMTSVPTALADVVGGVTTDLATATHQDEAVLALDAALLGPALDRLPPGSVAPVLLLMQDQNAVVDLGDVTTNADGAYAVDLRSAVPATSKSMRLDLYATGAGDVDGNGVPDGRRRLDAVEVGPALAQLFPGSTSDSGAAVMATIWSAGESHLVEVGGQPVLYDMPEKHIVDDALKSGIQWSAGAVLGAGVIHTAIEVGVFAGTYRTFKMLAANGWSSSFKGAITKVGAWSSAKLLHGSSMGLGSLGRFKNVVKVAGKTLAVVGVLIDVGLALYTFFQIGIGSGWTNVGTSFASVTLAVYLSVAAGLTALSLAFPVGTVIAVVLGVVLVVLDLFDVGLDALLGKLVDWFGSTHVLEEPKFRAGRVKLDIDDADDNGLDVGDRIGLRTDYFTERWTRSWGNTGDWRAVTSDMEKLGGFYGVRFAPSAPEVYERVDLGMELIPPGFLGTTTNWRCGPPLIPCGIIDHRLHTLWFNAGAPSTAHRWDLVLVSEVDLPYWSCFPFESEATCDQGYHFVRDTAPPESMYFDVMPASFADFADWSTVTPLDRDRDGLDYGDEQAHGTDPDNPDHDGDGSLDGFEVAYVGGPWAALHPDLRLDPRSPDTDVDGLGDHDELLHGTDPLDADSDDDALVDGEEVAGWTVQFRFGNQQVSTVVHSDPLVANSDEDGLADVDERQLGLNPTSRDTNGDGVDDGLGDEGTVSVTGAYTWSGTIDADQNAFTVLVGADGRLRRLVGNTTARTADGRRLVVRADVRRWLFWNFGTVTVDDPTSARSAMGINFFTTPQPVKRTGATREFTFTGGSWIFDERGFVPVTVRLDLTDR